MNSIEVNESRCPKNHPCPVVMYCPAGAITQKDYYSAPEIDESLCTKCGRCLRMCGYGAFQPASKA
ncbi:MAG: 4Fe-4S binding protein [Bacteroidales bacterium]|nr:4Fe-4S binding protein [Bacteroidales bacterium]MBN2748172.1 4Fe-4S binding protein [Bacteroidales bacterium]